MYLLSYARKGEKETLIISVTWPGSPIEERDCLKNVFTQEEML